MKKHVFMVVLSMVFAFALVGCSNKPKPEKGLLYYSYEELAQAKAEAAKNGFKNDVYALKKLKYYYVPVYAEVNWQFKSGDLYDISMTVNYNSAGLEQGQSDFMLWVSRGEGGKERFENRINPSIPYDNSPKPFEDVEGVYYREGSGLDGSRGTSFYWVYERHYCFMQIDQKLLDEIRTNNPEVLKGALFQLQKVELK